LECEEKGDDNLKFGFGHNPIKKKDGQSIEKQKVHRKSLFKNWPIISSIIVYSFFSLHEVAYSEIFSLWAESPKAYGGLGFTTKDVGTVLSITGVGVLIFQLLIFPSIANLTGAILITRIPAVLTIPVLASYPFICMLSGVSLCLEMKEGLQMGSPCLECLFSKHLAHGEEVQSLHGHKSVNIHHCFQVIILFSCS